MRKVIEDKKLRKTFIEIFSESTVVFNLRGYQLVSIFKVIWRLSNVLFEQDILNLLKALQQSSC